jgi:hypothetical protein
MDKEEYSLLRTVACRDHPTQLAFLRSSIVVRLARRPEYALRYLHEEIASTTKDADPYFDGARF